MTSSVIAIRASVQSPGGLPVRRSGASTASEKATSVPIAIDENTMIAMPAETGEICGMAGARGLPGLEGAAMLVEQRNDQLAPGPVRRPDPGDRFVRHRRRLLQHDGAVQEHDRGRTHVDLAVHQHLLARPARERCGGLEEMPLLGVCERNRD